MFFLKRKLPKLKFIVDKEGSYKEYCKSFGKISKKDFDKKWKNKFKPSLDKNSKKLSKVWKPKEKQVLKEIAKIFYPWKLKEIIITFLNPISSPRADLPQKKIMMNPHIHSLHTLIHELIHINGYIKIKEGKIPSNSNSLYNVPDLKHTIYVLATAYINNKFFKKAEPKISKREERHVPLVKKEVEKYLENPGDFDMFYEKLERKIK